MLEIQLRKIENGREYHLTGAHIESLPQMFGIQLANTKYALVHAEPELAVLYEFRGLMLRGHGEAWGTSLTLYGPVDPRINSQIDPGGSRPNMPATIVWHDEIWDRDAINRLGTKGAICSVPNDERIEEARKQLFARAEQYSRTGGWPHWFDRTELELANNDNDE
ncbi:hypothetical protein M0R72_01045 [Candidatus Pacearchaeota archaeon]|jgi:hypothetical protein|nr:hypothetical protein [Candidatus Pacearchaeota archaeon]